MAETNFSYDDLEADLYDRTASFFTAQNWAKIANEYLEKEQDWVAEKRRLKWQLIKYKIGFYSWPVFVLGIYLWIKWG